MDFKDFNYLYLLQTEPIPEFIWVVPFLLFKLSKDFIFTYLCSCLLKQWIRIHGLDISLHFEILCIYIKFVLCRRVVNSFHVFMFSRWKFEKKKMLSLNETVFVRKICAHVIVYLSYVLASKSSRYLYNIKEQLFGNWLEKSFFLVASLLRLLHLSPELSYPEV